MGLRFNLNPAAPLADERLLLLPTKPSQVRSDQTVPLAGCFEAVMARRQFRPRLEERGIPNMRIVYAAPSYPP